MLFSKLSKQLLLILCLCIILFLFMRHEDSIKSTSNVQNHDKERPTAFMEGSKITTYDTAGNANFVLNSDQALFYDDKHLIVLKNPKIEFADQGLNQNNELEYQKIYLNSDNAQFDTKEEILFLSDNVTLSMPGIEQNIELSTHKLKFEKKTRFISTDELVTITKGNGTLTAKGLNAWPDDKKVRLISKVRGQYVLNGN